MALFTGKGDSGTAKLFDTPKGQRISKSSAIFECLGQLDELNTVIGWCKMAAPDDLLVQGTKVKDMLDGIQNDIFTIQAEVAGSAKSVPQSRVESVSALINEIEK